MSTSRQQAKLAIPIGSIIIRHFGGKGYWDFSKNCYLEIFSSNADVFYFSKIGTEYTATRYLLQNSFRFRIGDGTGVPFYQRLVATDMLDTLRDISSGPFTVWDIKASPIDLLVRNFEVAEGSFFSSYVITAAF